MRMNEAKPSPFDRERFCSIHLKKPGNITEIGTFHCDTRATCSYRCTPYGLRRKPELGTFSTGGEFWNNVSDRVGRADLAKSAVICPFGLLCKK